LVLIVTVQVEEFPPVTVAGLSFIEVGQRAAPSDGFMVTGALALELP
jgi:hypothetical protein